MELRRALIDLGIGLWLTDPAAKTYAAGARARGKKGGVIACAMAHRANRIAFALVRDQASYDPDRWIKLGTPIQPTLRNPRTRRPFTTPAGGARLERDEGPDQTPLRLWRTPHALRRT